jgi:hypothetical protein
MIELMLQAERALMVGMIDQAERLYQMAARNDPRNAIAVVGLARVALERNDDRAAYDRSREALAIDPNNAAALRLEARLSEVLVHRGERVERPEFVLAASAVARAADGSGERDTHTRPAGDADAFPLALGSSAPATRRTGSVLGDQQSGWEPAVMPDTVPVEPQPTAIAAEDATGSAGWVPPGWARAEERAGATRAAPAVAATSSDTDTSVVPPAAAASAPQASVFDAHRPTAGGVPAAAVASRPWAAGGSSDAAATRSASSRDTDASSGASSAPAASGPPRQRGFLRRLLGR